MDERGYGSIETVIGSCCVGDYALKAFIKRNGTKQKCDYCGKNRICVNLEELLELIVRSAKEEYEDANGCMGWNGREGGFQGAPTFDNWDFVYEILNDEMEIENDALLKDIIFTLNDSVVWCENDPYGLRIHEEDYVEWEEFCNSVKKDKLPITDMALSHEILDTIGQYIEELGLIVTNNKKTGYFRSRPDNKSIYNTAKSLGSAPSEFAEENRMSQKGTSMFYGSEDIETTLREIDTRGVTYVSSAKFFPTVALRVLDLTKLKLIKFPSLFDEAKRKLRSPLIFLRSFASDISKPVKRSKKVGYLPTQVFTEYLRHVYKSIDDNKIDGIIYESSKISGRKCCVLFFDNNGCTDSKKEKTKKLWMDKETIAITKLKKRK